MRIQHFVLINIIRKKLTLLLQNVGCLRCWPLGTFAASDVCDAEDARDTRLTGDVGSANHWRQLPLEQMDHDGNAGHTDR